MGNAASRLTDREMADLCALADGTLAADRREAVEAWVAASPELQLLLERQRRSLQATRAAASEPLPPALAAAAEARLPDARRGTRRFVPRLAVAGAAVAVVVAVALVLALSGGSGEPTVAEAAELAALQPSGPAPARAEGSPAELAAGVEGVKFPNLQRAYRWRAAGVRRGSIDGRTGTVVYYRNDGRRIAYAIVSGSALPPPAGAARTVRRGVEYDTLRAAGHQAVTWRRVGHTCVLTGTASRAELLTLASWRGGGALRY